MATWARRLSAAQAKQPGTARRAADDLPADLPDDINPQDKIALRSLGHIARDRAGFCTRIVVRVGDGPGSHDLEIEVAHGPEGPVFTVLGPPGEGASSSASTAGRAPDTELSEPHEGEASEEPDVVDLLTDALVMTSDMVAVFASVGAEALWANDAFATAIPIRASDQVWLVELLDEWSKGHFEVNVLPALVQHGRWHGRLVIAAGEDVPEREVLASIVAHRDRTGEIEAITLIAHDIADLRVADQIQQSGDPQLAALVEHLTDILVVLEPDWGVKYASPAVCRLLGVDDGALDGSNLLERVSEEHREAIDLARLAVPDEDGIPSVAELRLKAEGGGLRILEVTVNDLRENAAIGGLVMTGRDVTDRIQAVQRLADRAYTDPLTLLPNRMRLLDRLGKALAEAEERTVVAMLFDVDAFEKVNEEHGTDVGDEVLRQIAFRLSDQVRPKDVVARLSGNEFAMVMRDVADMDGALVAADRVRSALSEPYRVGKKRISLTVSVGIAPCQKGQSAEELLADADEAVGIAKENGGDRIEVMTAELRSSTARRRDIEGILRRAITEGEGIEVHYQPVFDLETQKPVAAEALLRVHDEEGALLSPASFLEAAEHTGLIGPLGSQVLNHTCRQLAEWISDGRELSPKQISVNVSPRQLLDPLFAASVADAVESAGISPECLALEITESAIMVDREMIDDTVEAVRSLGVSIGLDEFGAGQSSLGSLRRFNLDFVKIDRELIAGLGRDEDDTAIVRATLELAHSLGLDVVAVGVETAEQREILELLGVDRAQGFYYLPALPADEMVERLEKHQAS